MFSGSNLWCSSQIHEVIANAPPYSVQHSLGQEQKGNGGGTLVQHLLDARHFPVHVTALLWSVQAAVTKYHRLGGL